MPTVLLSTQLTEVRGFSDFYSEFYTVGKAFLRARLQPAGTNWAAKLPWLEPILQSPGSLYQAQQARMLNKSMV